MAKNKEKVEFITEPKKISAEHLVRLQSLVNKINGIQFNVGKIEAQKHAMLHDFKIEADNIKSFQDTLVKNYGTFDVNVTDGVINLPEDK